ncbi:MAG: nicotinate (nicotinamide) nucleotide adenylyltransferase [Desulfobacterium sp.]|nr:nicotinate (nicotinamide) nucleotide adenylyltransferase [Desulfobacterium sp.]
MIEGIFGGTFNPLHRGHLDVIAHVKETFSLTRVHLIPSAIPPHKSFTDLAPARDRFEMVKRSIAGIQGLIASDVELNRKGPSFTVDTIDHFRKNLPPGTDLRLIVGSDAFLEMDTWKQGREIFQLISIIVMIRPDQKKRSKSIASFLKDVISEDYRPGNGQERFTHPVLKPVYACKVPEIDISSTLIRQYVKKHLPLERLVPDPVEEIIKIKGLYL